jgi:hypothetical protein
MSLDTRICSTCGFPKTLDRFQKRLYTTKDGEVKFCYLSECMDCKNERARKNNPNTKDKRKKTRAAYYQNNKAEIRDKGDLYYQENRDAVLSSQKEYQAANKDKVRESKRRSEKNREKNDPSFKLRKRVSAQVRDHLRRFGSSKKGNSILEFLNYSVDDLRAHLEKQFGPWMTWDNYGFFDSKTWDDEDQTTWTWSIDHIIPQYRLPYQAMDEDNFKKCWALENLRPLSAKQNLLDGVNKVR